MPLTALTAYQALDLLKVEAGKTIFITGGTGGSGALAIPLAKARGLRVVTNGRATHKDRLMALGVDKFIDYQTEDFVDVLSDVDYVIDTLGGDDTMKLFKILKNGGAMVSLNAMPNKVFAKRMGMSAFKQFLFGLVGRKYDKVASQNNQRYDFIFAQSSGKDLADVSRILIEGQVPVSIDTIYDFKDINQAIDKLKNGYSKGKSVLRVNNQL